MLVVTIHRMILIGRPIHSCRRTIVFSRNIDGCGDCAAGVTGMIGAVL